MPKITSIHAREILDSRGNPTVEVELELNGAVRARTAVPSGASTGSHEALELRDQDLKRYAGRGVSKAVENINQELSKELIGKNLEQPTLDQAMIKLDGTTNKARLGANALLGVSLAFARASAMSENVALYHYFGALAKNKTPALPVPHINIINGGAHAENSTDIQEFMVLPVGLPTFREALRAGAETFHALKKIIQEKGFSTTVGDEGGYAPKLDSNEQALELIMEAIVSAGYVPGKHIALGIDAAANEFYREGHYELRSESKKLSAVELIDRYSTWAQNYPLISIEDGLMEDDWDGFKNLTEALGQTTQIVGDDLFVTNINRLNYGLEHHAANAILVKLNQIGTVTETINVIIEAQKAGYHCIISHRSGETEDTSIADLAVGTGVGQIKTGSTCRGERINKYNQLLRIEEELGPQARYIGTSAFPFAIR